MFTSFSLNVFYSLFLSLSVNLRGFSQRHCLTCTLSETCRFYKPQFNPSLTRVILHCLGESLSLHLSLSLFLSFFLSFILMSRCCRPWHPQSDRPQHQTTFQWVLHKLFFHVLICLLGFIIELQYIQYKCFLYVWPHIPSLLIFSKQMGWERLRGVFVFVAIFELITLNTVWL